MQYMNTNNFSIESFSKKYTVRELKEKDISIILSLCKSNPVYFEYCPPMINEAGVLEDMFALPPQKSLEDKYYVGYFENDKLIAILDLIKDYPNVNTAFIGLFMVDAAIQKKGIGSFIIKELFRYLKEENYRYVELAWVKGNKQSESFWMKNGFEIIEERQDQNEHKVIKSRFNLNNCK